MDSQYSDIYSESSMETHAEDDSSITTEDRDENSSEEEQSCTTTEDSSEEEIGPWSTLINDAASQIRGQYDDMYGVREGTKFVLIILGPINTSSSWSLRQRVAVLNRTRVH